MTDAMLADQAPLIVRARVVSIDEGPAGSMPSTDYTIELSRVLKGDAPGSTVIVRLPGGRAAEGRSLHILAAPRFAVGDRPLLFLAPRRDGTFGVLHLMLGAFHESLDGSQFLAIRHLEEAHSLRAGEAEPVRTLRKFERWLEDRAAGWDREPDYLVRDLRSPVSRGGAAGRSAGAEFSYIQGFHVRWFDFDQGTPVVWRAHQAGQPNLAGGGFNEFQQALAVWNDDPGTNIQYSFGGTTSVDTGFQDFDGANVILFEDPHGEASGSFSCPGGGVLAIGGPWFDDETPTPHPIDGADIVVNDGAGCWFQSDPKRAAEVYAHELGHTLGLGHSCGDDRSGDCDTTAKSQALMNARAKNLSKGARLEEDDRAGVLSLYGSGGGLGAPANLRATATTRTSVTLAWDDVEGESQYLIESRKLPSGKFRQVATNGRNRLSKTIGGLKPNAAYEFRVRSKAGKKLSPFSLVLTVTTAR